MNRFLFSNPFGLSDTVWTIILIAAGVLVLDIIFFIVSGAVKKAKEKKNKGKPFNGNSEASYALPANDANQKLFQQSLAEVFKVDPSKIKVFKEEFIPGYYRFAFEHDFTFKNKYKIFIEVLWITSLYGNLDISITVMNGVIEDLAVRDKLSVMVNDYMCDHIECQVVPMVDNDTNKLVIQFRRRYNRVDNKFLMKNYLDFCIRQLKEDINNEPDKSIIKTSLGEK